MSEISEKPVYRIDAGPFLVAFIGGPLLVTLATFWIYFIPVIALIYGGPIYLILGLPIGILHLKHNRGDTPKLTQLALTAVGGIALPLVLIAAFVGGGTAAAFIAAMALVFAAAWSFAAGTLYNLLRSEASRTPINESRAHVFE